MNSMKERLLMGIWRDRLHELFAFAVICLLILPLGCCNQANVSVEYPISIIDSAGKRVLLNEPVERIIVLNRNAAEAVTILGDKNKIIGVSDDIISRNDYFPELKNCYNVAKGSEINYELIGEIAKSGDSIAPNIIVICYSWDRPNGAAAVEENLRQFHNITTIGLDFYKPENLTEEMELLGIVLDHEEKAQEYIKWYDQKFLDVKNVIAGLPTPDVYYETSNPRGELGGLPTSGNGSGLNDLQNAAGGKNLAADLETYPKVTWEWVISRDPEIIIRTAPHGGDDLPNTFGWETSPSETADKLQAIRDEIAQRPGASKIRAICENKTFLLYYDMCFGLDSPVGLSYLAKILHPEININPEGVYREYLKILGVSYPENHIFTYPSI